MDAITIIPMALWPGIENNIGKFWKKIFLESWSKNEKMEGVLE